MTYTTLKAIRAHRPCQPGWEKLLASLGKTKADDEPLAMTTILDSNGIDDANWCLRALGPEYHKMIVGLACNYVEMAMEYAPAGETRPAECIRVTRLWIEGKATLKEVEAALWTARRAVRAAESAQDAAERAVRWAVDATEAAEAAEAAAEAARAARAVRWAARWAVNATRATERAALWAVRAAEAAEAEMREKQAARFREVMEAEQ